MKKRQKSNALAYNITPDSSIASPPSEIARSCIVSANGGCAGYHSSNAWEWKHFKVCTSFCWSVSSKWRRQAQLWINLFRRIPLVNFQFVLKLQFSLIIRRKFHFCCHNKIKYEKWKENKKVQQNPFLYSVGQNQVRQNFGLDIWMKITCLYFSD